MLDRLTECKMSLDLSKSQLIRWV